MSWSSDQDRHIARALGRAIRHVRRVAIRPHITTDRDERLNQFVVSLRRELVQLKNSTIISVEGYNHLCDVLTDKKHWYDIGEPNASNASILTGTTGPTRYGQGTVASSDLVRWLRLSKHLETETEAQALRCLSRCRLRNMVSGRPQNEGVNDKEKPEGESEEASEDAES